MKKMKKRMVSILCIFSMLFGSFAGVLPVSADSIGDGGGIIESSDIPLRLWYDEPAPITDTENSPNASSEYGGSDVGWAEWSLPIGNGYFGANVFGRTETERVQITEKTLVNNFGDSTGQKLVGGLNSFSETYIDFGHADVSDYTRYLDMKTAISGVEYVSGGVKYTREYFVSYPDKAIIIRLDSDTDGALSFTLRPTVPYKQDYRVIPGDGGSKTGVVDSYVENGVGTVELYGQMGKYQVDFLSLYNVYTDGGTISASTAENTYKDSAGVYHTDTNGTIVVDGAKSAYIVITLGTDYELSSEMFTAANSQKPTTKTTLEDTRIKVEAEMAAIEAKLANVSYDGGYELLRSAHISDHGELFGRVTVDLGCKESDFDITTDILLENYKDGNQSTYLETLLFQYGRYLLIASSRDGTLPANLQGVWNTYNNPPWGSGYWFNINVQMNYWPAFSTNLSETFSALTDLMDAYMEKLEQTADSNISKYYPELYDKDGGNGWSISTGNFPYTVGGDRSAGNLGLTTQLYWDYYEFTRDPEALRMVYDILTNAAKYITKIVSLDENGNYLVDYCDSPEVHVNGVWYYTSGTTYAQTFAYLNNYHALLAAKELGIDLNDTALLSSEEYSILNTILEQIDKYDPIQVGLSGQIKEFREEDYYSSVGDDPNHRHVSQLMGLYPGNIINATTPAWLDAARVTLDKRSGGNSVGGWVYAHKSSLYARVKDGEMAHEMVQGILEKSTFANLFTKLWSVYQIDSSFGITAGIAEMLLQSHEGYISPLAAIPEEWNSGSYTGLMARGNFEVSAEWENGVAKTFNILSQLGGEVSVYYPSITEARVVRASDGKTVKYTVSDKDLITFDTESGETYIIYGFKKLEAPKSPAALNYSRTGFEQFNLTWTSSERAEFYNVYVATENAADYTLVTSVKGNTAIYLPEKEYENARTTFAVTAVSADGVESGRTLCYYNPEDTSATVEETVASVTAEGELQVSVKANGNTIKYRLYEMKKGETEYTLVDESGFPLLYTAGYSKDSKYSVTAVSYYDGEESELFEVKDFGSKGVEYDAKNILLGKSVVQTEGSRYNQHSEQYGYAKLTDGSYVYNQGRYSSQKTTNAASPKSASATIDLGGTYVLSEIRFFAYERRTVNFGTNFTIEVYSNGKWVKVVDNLSNDELVKNHTKILGNADTDFAVAFDLGCIKGSKIRFTSDAILNNTVTWYEVECSGILLNEKNSNYENVFEGKEFIGSEKTAENYGYDKLTDGVISGNSSIGRYSSLKNGRIDGTITLGAIYSLEELRLYDFKPESVCGFGDIKIEAVINGAWVTLLSIEGREEIEKYRVTESTAVGGTWLSFELGGVQADKLRISGTAVSGMYITLYEMECIGVLVKELGEYVDNILLNKEFVPAPGCTALNATYGYDKLTDGSFVYNQGRFSATKNKNADATVDLGGEYILSSIKFYDYVEGGNYEIASPTHAGNNLTIQVYSVGNWITVYQFETLEDLQPYRVKTGVKGHGQGWLLFELGNIRAEKIRFFATPSTGTSTVTYYEIECSGYAFGAGSDEDTSTNALGDKNVTLSPSYGEEYNVLFNKTVIPTDGAEAYLDSSSKAYSALTDGCAHNNDRLTTVQNGVIGATFDLEGAYKLSSFRLKWYSGAAYVGSALKLSVYADGQWTVAAEYSSNADIWKCRSGNWLDFKLGGVYAEKIKIEITAVQGKQLSFAEMECSGTPVLDVPVTTDNISNVNDGKLDTSITVSGSASYSLTFDLGGSKSLHTLRIYELVGEGNLIDGVLATASDDTLVEVYRNGVWLKAADGVSLDANAIYTEIGLYGVECEKVRITFNNTRLFDGENDYRAAVIREISCTEMRNVIDRTAMIEALEKLASAAGEDELRYLYDEKYLTFKKYASDFTADQATVDGYAAEINAYYNELTENPTKPVCFNYVDSEGYKLAPTVYKYIAAGDDFTVISPAIDGYYTREIYVHGVMDAEGKTVNVVYYPIPENADAETVEKLVSNIVAWGDSITAGSGANNLTSATEYGIDLEALGSVASGANYVTVLKNLIMSRIYGGIAVDGCGVGGEASSTIAARADTETYYLYLDGAVTVGTDAVTVPLTHYASGGRVGILRQGNDSHINPVTIKGYDANGNEISVVGKISMTLTDDAPEGTDKRTCDAKYLKYTFTRTDGGTEALSFVSGARVITKASYIYDGRTCIIFMGENGGYSDVNELIKQQEEILKACGDPEYFLIISSTSGSNESRKEIREALSARWGRSYINMGDELNSSRASYELAGYSKEVIDSIQANIDEGTVTTLLLADRCHPNAVGYAVAGNIIFERLYEIGAFDAVLDYYDHLNGLTDHVYDGDKDADCNVCGEVREVEIPVTEIAKGTCGVNTTWVLTSDGVLTISGNGDTEDYLVSITTEQPYRAYADKITKVVIEEGVTSIGRGAFYGFTAITEVVFPESLIAIHEYAFFGCTGIKNVTIPENTFYIGMYAFRKSGLTEMTFANAEGWKFADGTVLDVTNVKAFTTEFTYKQTCMRPVYEDGEIIANGVFGNKDQFSWTLTSTGLLTVSGNGAMPKFNVNTTPWYGYRGAIRSVVIEEGITSVGRCSFHTCRAITSVTLPESLETIAEYAFYNCQFLTEATIPANVTRIEIYAFRKCFQLKDVTFTLNYGWTAGDSKVSATEINSNAADMLTLVNYTKIWTRDVNAEEEVLDPNYVTGGACNTTVKWSLTYTDETKTSMKLTISGTGAMPKFETAGTPWYGYLNDIVEVEVCEGITEIGRCSFYGLKFVKVATIADTVTSINDYAFSGCFSLKSIEIPASVTYIAETSFTKTGLSEIPTV